MATPEKMLITLDPRDESDPGPALLAPRPSTLNGKTLGLLSNNKPHSEELLRMIAATIKERYDIKGTVEYNKGSHQWPASSEALKEFAAKCDVAIHATAE
jgi:hypothetical protein